MAEVTVAKLSGLFKEVYGDVVQWLVPDLAIVALDIKFASGDKMPGNYYHQPVLVSRPAGYTYTAPGSGVVTLKDAIPLQLQDAQVRGSQITLREQIDMEAAARASSAGARAFQNTVGLVTEAMREGMSSRLELSLLYGQLGIATAASSANTNATTTVFIVTLAQWAAGIWAGLESAQIQFYTSNTTLVSSGTDSVFTITAINNTTRAVTVTGSATGITALDIAIAANADDVNVYFNGAFSNEMAGIHKILANTGTLFNVSATNYSLWGANSSAVGGALTFAKLQSGLAMAVQRGLKRSVKVYVNPVTYGNLNSDMAAARIFDSGYTGEKGENGFKRIKFFGINGEIEIIPHPALKQGFAYAVPTQNMKRIGEQEPSFKIPGMGEDMFVLVQDKSAFEMRMYTSQAVFLETPAQAVLFTGIVNT
jgi:hypothetical protein